MDFHRYLSNLNQHTRRSQYCWKLFQGSKINNLCLPLSPSAIVIPEKTSHQDSPTKLIWFSSGINQQILLTHRQLTVGWMNPNFSCQPSHPWKLMFFPPLLVTAIFFIPERKQDMMRHPMKVNHSHPGLRIKSCLNLP